MPRRDRTHRPSEDQAPLLEVDPTPTTLNVPITVEALAAALAPALEQAHLAADHHEWQASPYAWLRTIPSAARGKIATTLVTRILAAAGIPTERRANAHHDLRVNGHTVKVRMSTRWSSGEYTFQNLATTTADVLILIGIGPHTTHLWALPLPLPAVVAEELSSTGWLTIPAAHPQPWLIEYGGNATEAFTALRRLTPGRH